MQNARGTVRLIEVVFPEHTNHYGTLFGGQALQLLSKAAFLSGRGFVRGDVVMARCGEVLFHSPVPLGSTLVLEAHVSRVGRSSLTVRVAGSVQDVATEALTRVLDGEFEMVAVDAAGRPVRLANTPRLHEKKTFEETV
ncbi:acyl-CoA hydrolase [Variovorax boronicumulans]|uniref:acyl-CoA thioesterase n=1 Tax=Variovorax boronicumulans TaxID=436515 RepID=UPI00247595E6|nr:hotdog domain-containing protein [Variovorax boronicumulans]MDH6166344.1 acyl-CoA hydrolase [Variovorax boronicumulans]